MIFARSQLKSCVSRTVAGERCRGGPTLRGGQDAPTIGPQDPAYTICRLEALFA